VNKIVKRFPLSHLACSLLVGLALVLASHGPVHANSFTFNWSGEVAGDDAAASPGFIVTGSAMFDVSGSTLTITLINTTSGIDKKFAVLSGITWDITVPGISGQDKKNLLTPLTADVAGGSSLVLPPDLKTDLSDEWGL